jgi:hypothetical protein
MGYLCVMNRKFNWDLLGVTASLACAIHCAILPLLITSLPLFGLELIDNIRFEYLMIVLTLVIGIVSLWHGYRRHHHSLTPILLFMTGILLLFAKQRWHDYQLLFLPFAVLCIVVAHVINYKSCRTHNHAHAEDCNH